MPKTLRLWLMLNVAALWGCAKNENGSPPERFEQSRPNLPETQESEPRSLSEAVKDRNLSAVKKMIRAGADINMRDASGFTPLELSLVRGFEEIAIPLSKHPNLDVRAVNLHGNSYLFLAAESGINDAVLNIIRNGTRQKLSADELDPRSMNGERAVHVANNDRVMQTLFDARASIHFDMMMVDELGRTPLHTAASAGRARALAWIIRQYSDNAWYAKYLDLIEREMPTQLGRRRLFNSQDRNGQTPLMLAVQAGSLASTKALLGCGFVDLKIVDFKNRNVFHWAALQDQYDILDALFLGPAINWKTADADGNLPLHYAANNSDYRFYDRMLREAGARIDRANASGSTPTQIFTCRANQKMGIQNVRLSEQCQNIHL